MIVRLTLLLLLIYLMGPTYAQQRIPGFKIFGKAEGVPNSSNNKLFESSDHFLWLSTQSGLYRFDGTQFNAFYSNSKDSTTLSSNVLSEIEEDRIGNLWVGTFGKGVNKLNRQTGKWKQYLHPTKDENPFYWIFDVFKDYKGRLWLGTNGRGLLLYDEKSDAFRQFIPDPTKNKTGTVSFENEIRGISADAKDPTILWLAGTDGLYRFDTKLESFTCFKHIKNGKAAWINNSFHFVYVQDETNIWLGAWGGGLIHFNTSSAVFTNYLPFINEYAKNSFAHNIISNINYCSDTSLYVSSIDAGLFEFDLKRRKFKLISETEFSEDKNISKEINGITHSSDGSTWICSPDYIFQKHPVYERLSKFQPFYQPKDKFIYRPSLNGVLFLKNKKQYWMSCNAGFGVYVFDSNFHYLRSIPIAGNLADRKLRDIVQDSMGTVWLRTQDTSHLYYYEKQLDRFLDASSKFKDPAFLHSGLIDMATDHSGNVWFANKTQLFKWNPGKQQLQYFPFKIAGQNNNQWLWVQLHFDNKNEPWLATNLGLYHYRTSTAVWEHLVSVQNNEQTLANNAIASISFDKKGFCWIAPMDEGLQQYDLSANLFTKHYVQAEGFIAQRVNDLETDNHGNIWAATINGLAKYDALQQRWYSFTKQDGLPIDNLDQLFALDDGSMILAVQDGFVNWNIHSFLLNNQKPILYFNHFVSGGKEIVVKNNGIHLPYSGNDLNIDFSAIATIMGDRTKFYYKILPHQNEWILSNQRSISLAGFASGEYSLYIKAVNSDGIESELKHINIVVAFPFWRKWWFILLSFISVTILLYLLYRYRVNQLLKLQQMRNNISRDLHDEIGSSVSSVNMLAMVAKKQLGEEHPITPLLTQIGQSAQSAGDSINEIIWSINPRNDSLDRIVLRMKELSAEMLEVNKINYRIDFDKDFSAARIPMEQRRHLFLLFKEALNNLIKYSHCENVCISMHIEGHFLRMKIEDDGIGFDLLNYIPGNGLVNMYQRAKEMKGNLEVVTAPGKGCAVMLVCNLK